MIKIRCQFYYAVAFFIGGYGQNLYRTTTVRRVAMNVKNVSGPKCESKISLFIWNRRKSDEMPFHSQNNTGSRCMLRIHCAEDIFGEAGSSYTIECTVIHSERLVLATLFK